MSNQVLQKLKETLPVCMQAVKEGHIKYCVYYRNYQNTFTSETNAKASLEILITAV